MWVEIDKEQCFIDIASGKLDSDKEDIRVVNFEDEGYVESLGNTEMSSLRYLVVNEDIKIYKKVIDTE